MYEIAGPSVAQKSSAGKMALGLSSNLMTEESVGGSDIERGDAARIANIPPARVPIPSESPVVQVTCGLHHTGSVHVFSNKFVNCDFKSYIIIFYAVVLLQSGEVYTFGSNVYGQLGVGDVMAHGGPVLVKLSGVATQVAAGSNHTVVLTSKGEVFTFGAYQVCIFLKVTITIGLQL